MIKAYMTMPWNTTTLFHKIEQISEDKMMVAWGKLSNGHEYEIGRRYQSIKKWEDKIKAKLDNGYQLDPKKSNVPLYQ